MLSQPMFEDRVRLLYPQHPVIQLVVVTFALLMLLVVLAASPPPEVAAVATGFAALFGLTAFTSLYHGLRDRRRIRLFAEHVAGVDKDSIMLSKPMLVERGVARLYWLGGRHPVSIVEFHSEATQTTDKLVFSRSGYSIVRGYGAAAVLPAYRILDSCCPGVIVAAAGAPITQCIGEKTLTTCSSDGDCATATISCSNGHLAIELNFAPASGRARAARLELHARIRVGRRAAKAAKTLCRVERAGVERSEEEASPSPILYAVFTTRTVSVKVIDALQRVKPIEGFHAKAEYYARLVIDKPVARDHVVEAPLAVETA